MNFNTKSSFIVVTVCLLLGWASELSGQKDFYNEYTFTTADTLRGMLRPERTCYDVYFYDLNIEVNPDQRFLEGYVDIYFHSKNAFDRLQIDLYANMAIDKIICQGKECSYQRQFDAVFVQTPVFQSGERGQLRIHYHGQPQVAQNPPWDGGFVWTYDENGKNWIGVACEGDGASLWWPNKDHLSDEPDSMSIQVTVPQSLVCIANGDLRRIAPVDQQKMRYEWFVSYPINNYNVTVNIGDYVQFGEDYQAQDGSKMPLDYYVLSYNKDQAIKHFQQVPGVLRCFEQYFGKYPFWEDGFALVETPYLGMEHQGAIAYGNQYKRGYLGGMIPEDMDWDYIIVHETGHEYFGNSVSCNDLSEMWIHESFTTYMEALYVECQYGYEDAIRYLDNFRNQSYIANYEPILGPDNVNWEDWQYSDHYFKGSWVLHTLRNAIDDDEKWFELLHAFYQRNAISNIHSETFYDLVAAFTEKDYGAFFEQYLEYPKMPVFEYRLQQDGLDLKVDFRWKAEVAAFDMPIKIGHPSQYQMVYPNTQGWKSIRLSNIQERL
ncbi:MAG: M1 family metallopeptidase [Bacteroidota bacterium]